MATKKKTRVRVKEFEQDGYLPNTARLMQLTALCTLIGSGNMKDSEVEEMKQLCGYYKGRNWARNPDDSDGHEG